MMESVLWLAVLATGFLVAVVSSRWAVGHLARFAAGTRIPPFVIGITLVAIGTDLPEIANSIVSSVTGHGDINIGDSIGSATVQATLILGLLPIVAGSFPIARGRVVRIGCATVGALLLGAVLMADGAVTRLDAILLIAVWLVGTVLVWREVPEEARPLPVPGDSSARHLALAAVGLLLVGLGATTAVQALTRLADLWSVPEYLIAFLLASLGTSLPELVVDITAVRQKQWDLAVGDALGSSFVDSTLSLAAGPVIAPIAVTGTTAVLGSLVAAACLGFVVLVLAVRRRHDWRSGLALIGIFLVAYLLVTTVG